MVNIFVLSLMVLILELSLMVQICAFSLMVLILVLSTTLLLKHLIMQFVCAYSTSGQFVTRGGADRPPQSQLHVSCVHLTCIS